MLERGAVEDEVDALHRAAEAVPIADVTDEKSNVAPSGVPLTLVELLRLVAAEDTHHSRLEFQKPLYEARSDRSGATRDEHATTAKCLEHVGVASISSVRSGRGSLARAAPS